MEIPNSFLSSTGFLPYSAFFVCKRLIDELRTIRIIAWKTQLTFTYIAHNSCFPYVCRRGCRFHHIRGLSLVQLPHYHLVPNYWTELQRNTVGISTWMYTVASWSASMRIKLTSRGTWVFLWAGPTCSKGKFGYWRGIFFILSKYSDTLISLFSYSNLRNNK